ncbi:autotransporter passenger strand-loop-strand repeat protein [Bradyrhizobium macuxiense]|uniref:Autotransporter passenger strand-loop-strand repeat protein n=1 Tax=Bradyrhizobium macuxiense TaxID=1755647 RepID=A0A560MH65_9BRAD|nr:AIDA repeat-containing protein [Bradyrhizobium macuxiense]TWC06727.1 autotransporter passenger strand-loop-strand repeat protein [Bradyrhizobium macuxiense]
MGVNVASGTSGFVSDMETNNTVQDGGTLYVLNGGYISNTLDVGTVIVSSGGTDFADTVSNDSNGAAQLEVYGSAISAVISGGNMVAISGGTAIDTTISGGRLSVDSGSVASNTTARNGWLTLFNGTAINNIVSGGGVEIYGGTTTNTTLVSGNQYISTEYDGYFEGSAVASNTTVTGSGSEQYVGFLGAGSAVSTIVAGGTQYIGYAVFGSAATGVASNTTITSGGIQYIAPYGYIETGTAINTTVTGSGSIQYVGSGQYCGSATAISTTLIAGGEQIVWGGGVYSPIASNTVISSGGAEIVSSGGIARTTVISAGGTETVMAGGIASSTVISSGGTEVVSSGGTASGITVNSGGTLIIVAGASVTGVTSNGGTVVIESAPVTVSSGSSYTVSSGQSDTGDIVLNGGSMFVASGGSAVSTTVSSGGLLTISNGGSDTGTTVSSGGTETVAGSDTNALVASGATMYVSGGGRASGTLVSGGTLDVLAGGFATGATVSAGGTLNVTGTTSNTVLVLSGGVENVSSGGVIQGTISGTTGTGTSVAAGATLNVLAGGSASMINVSGTLNVQGKITSNVTIQSGGHEIVSAGGSVTGVTGSGTAISGLVDVLSGASFEYATIFSGGDLNVSSGATVDHISVSNGGIFNVGGTVLSNVAVLAGGVENVLSGGVVTGVTGSGTGISGGTVNVSSGGAIDHTTVSSGGVLNILSGATAHHVAVSSGGMFNVAGAAASNVTVFAGGTEVVSSGGSTGPVTISGGTVELQAGSVASGGITFSGSGGQLKIDATSMPTTTISSLVLGDSIDLAGVTFSSGGSVTLLPGNVLQVTEGGTSYDLQLDQTPGVRFGVSADSGTGTLVTTRADVAPVTTAANVTAVLGEISVLASALFGFTDADGDAITQFAFWDTQGNGHWAINGVAQQTNAEIDVPAANLSQVSYVFGPSGSTDTLFVRANDGTAWGSWTQFTATGFVDTPPTVNAINVTAVHGQTSVAASSLFTVSDPDHDSMTEYALWDTGGSGHWVVNGVAQAANTEIDITAAQLSQVSYVFGPVGSTPDTLYIRANDGTLWGGWTALTATPGPDRAPVVTAANLVGQHLQLSVPATSIFSATDPDGDPITQYALWDAGGNGHWVVNGVAQAANTEIDVSAANLSQVSYVFGPSGSAPDMLYVRASDGMLWGGWTAFSTMSGGDTAPVVTAPNVTATHGEVSALASSLFSVTDADNDTMTQYAFWDTGGNGHWVVNGVAQAANTEIDVAAANLSQVSYVFGPGGSMPDTLYVRANDGQLWSSWTAFTATPGIDDPPVVAAPNVTANHGEFSALASSLFSVTDPESDPITQYAFWDTGGNGHWVVNGVAQAANVEIDVAAANLSQVSYVFGPGGSASDTLYVRAKDAGSPWSTWTAFTASPGPDTAPVVTAPNVTANHGQFSALASSLFSVTDADNDTMTQYAFWDTGGNGHWVVNGVAQAANVEIDVSAANLSQVSYVFGPGGSTPDTLYVRANDGSRWSTWTAFTAAPGVDTAPVVTAANVTANHGQFSALASSLFSVSDAESDPITQYAFWDTGGNGHWVVNGVAQAANVEIDVSAANLSQVSYVFGPGGSTPDTLYVRANDGSKWSAWAAFTAASGVDTAPVVTAANVAANHGQFSVLASSLFSVSDADNDAITQYAFWDTGGNGHWVVNGVAQAANVEIDVSAANLSQVSYVFGPGGSPSDTLYVRANDGSKWSSWTAFTATPGPDHAPVVTAANVSGIHDHSIAATGLFSVTDADSDTMTQYAFWDTGGNGHFVVNGVVQAADTEIDVSAANLSQVSYVFGPGGSPSDTLYVRANDGSEWSSWTAFTATATNQAPTVAVANVLTVSGQTFAAANLVTATDADGDPITKYALWDSNTNGRWTVGGLNQPANTEIDVTAAQLSQATYQAGSGTDQLWIRAYDGIAWGAWQSFNVTGESPSSASIAAGATLELPGASNAAVSFQGSTGTLKLDNSASFSGTVAGMTDSDAIDFANIGFANVQTPSFSGNTSGGTLTVTDGTVTASIALLGNYMTSTFTTSSDGHGGTLVVDPPATQVSQLAQPQHA